jgi:hypothetical protein
MIREMGNLISPKLMYASVRQEILDQKRCQFQIFSAAVTLTAAVMAYASSSTVGRVQPLVFVAPVILNVLALTIILDKAISIQRMVGYLQLMESDTTGRRWMWEYHLNRFRGKQGRGIGPDQGRKHNYIRTVALMLICLNIGMTLLYFFGPEAVALRQTPVYEKAREVYGAIDLIVLALNIIGIGTAWRRWLQLVSGMYTSVAIRKQWEEVLNEDRHNPADPVKV